MDGYRDPYTGSPVPSPCRWRLDQSRRRYGGVTVFTARRSRNFTGRLYALPGPTGLKFSLPCDVGDALSWKHLLYCALSHWTILTKRARVEEDHVKIDDGSVPVLLSGFQATACASLCWRLRSQTSILKCSPISRPSSPPSESCNRTGTSCGETASTEWRAKGSFEVEDGSQPVEDGTQDWFVEVDEDKKERSGSRTDCLKALDLSVVQHSDRLPLRRLRVGSQFEGFRAIRSIAARQPVDGAWQSI
ncbi:hypothetical protein B0H14DRAFT_2630844 [Mycena olivaceomarginata]|nr:hypothetical protein B0H14DRAFT_2630844 [Mycena olivaceomarginata]